MSLKGKGTKLYHGSSTKIKGSTLKPSKSCRVSKSSGKRICDRVPKVYTTTNEKVALLFASSVPAKTAEIQKDGKTVVFYVQKKYLNHLKKPGYIYEVDKVGFKKGPRTKYNEYVSNKFANIVKKKFVRNVFKEIMKDKNIILVLD